MLDNGTTKLTFFSSCVPGSHYLLQHIFMTGSGGTFCFVFLFILFCVILFPSMLSRQVVQCVVHIQLMIASRDMDDLGTLLATQ